MKLKLSLIAACALALSLPVGAQESNAEKYMDARFGDEANWPYDFRVNQGGAHGHTDVRVGTPTFNDNHSFTRLEKSGLADR